MRFQLDFVLVLATLARTINTWCVLDTVIETKENAV